MSKIFKPFKSLFRNPNFNPLRNSNACITHSLFKTPTRNFSGPQEPPDTRDPADVEPDFWDAWQWEKVIKDLENEIEHYDPHTAIIPIEDFQYDLKFAKKMLSWRELEETKYLQVHEQWDEGAIEYSFAHAGYKVRGEIDFRVVGGRGGYDTKQLFNDGQFVFGPFGTEDLPVYIPSRGRFRYVGCYGGYNGTVEHEIAWFVLRQGPKHRCPLCGQIFQLWTTDSSHKDHPYHDPTKDYDAEIDAMLDEHIYPKSKQFPVSYPGVPKISKGP